MPSPQSLRRLANLTKKVRDDMRTGGMAVNFRYLFRSTAILARVVEILADHVATEAEERQAEELAEALEAARAETTGTPGENSDGQSSPEQSSPEQSSPEQSSPEQSEGIGDSRRAPEAAGS